MHSRLAEAGAAQLGSLDLMAQGCLIVFASDDSCQSSLVAALMLPVVLGVCTRDSSSGPDANGLARGNTGMCLGVVDVQLLACA